MACGAQDALGGCTPLPLRSPACVRCAPHREALEAGGCGGHGAAPEMLSPPQPGESDHSILRFRHAALVALAEDQGDDARPREALESGRGGQLARRRARADVRAAPLPALTLPKTLPRSAPQSPVEAAPCLDGHARRLQAAGRSHGRWIGRQISGSAEPRRPPCFRGCRAPRESSIEGRAAARASAEEGCRGRAEEAAPSDLRSAPEGCPPFDPPIVLYRNPRVGLTLF